MILLQLGQTVHLESDWVSVTVPGPVDLSVLVCNDTGKVAGDDDMYFYNRPAGPGVRVDNSVVSLALTELRPGAHRLVIVASPADQVSTFGALPAVHVDIHGGANRWTFAPTGLSIETCLVLVEVYLHGNAWKVRALGQGYENGLAGVVTDYGINIEPGPVSPTAQASPPLAASRPTAPVAGSRLSRCERKQPVPPQPIPAGIDADPARQERARNVAVALADVCRQANAVYEKVIEHVQDWERARDVANADYIDGVQQHPLSKQAFANTAKRIEGDIVPLLHQLRGIAVHGRALRSDLFVVVGGPTGDFRTTAEWLSSHDLPGDTATAVIAQGIVISANFGVTPESFLAENERINQILSR